MEKAEELGTLPPELGEEDMIYYLFLIHDLNGDGFLDGHELREAFTDFVGHGENNKNDDNVASSFQIPMTNNNSGLISWSEYLESQSYHGQ
ncbi:hypothetical protein BDF20DRAFT_849875 [Mycotypha africana]|uniref:uncharacterized protein n=1 Tax=Mycotypha africana TaxID=64632 RepID=UPI00230112A5|nr:uncharacterized protein BDF20DRAFT_849875 [Mycotypha africana]KAI8987376.1 hypothetical protein BDF20DRAFT_849875 [Mycotypha africana]